jgi:hypothetical protein
MKRASRIGFALLPTCAFLMSVWVGPALGDGWRHRGVIYLDEPPYAKLHPVPVRASARPAESWGFSRRDVAGVFGIRKSGSRLKRVRGRYTLADLSS